MQLASVSAEGRGATDRLLAAIVARLGGEGVRIAGVLRAVAPGAGRGHCDSALRILPDGPVVEITQDLGSGSAACRMDAGALEAAVARATQSLNAEGADIVVLNKFGMSEAEGRGFRTFFADALERGIPVLTGVSDVHRAAFERFAGGISIALPADEEAVLAWCRDAMKQVTEENHVV